MKKIQVIISSLIILFIFALMIGTLMYFKSLGDKTNNHKEAKKQENLLASDSKKSAEESSDIKASLLTDKISIDIKEDDLVEGKIFLATKYFKIADPENFSDIDKKRAIVVNSISTNFQIIQGHQCDLNSMAAECLVIAKNKKTNKLLYITLGYHFNDYYSEVAIDAIVNNIPPFEYSKSNPKVGAMMSDGKLLYTDDRSLIKNIKISEDNISNKKIENVFYNDKNKSIVISYIDSSVITVIFADGNYKNFILPITYNGYSTYSIKPINNGNGYIIDYIKPSFNNRPSLLGLLLPNKNTYKLIYKKEFYTLPNLKQSKDGNLIYFLADGRNMDYNKAYVWSKSNGLKEIKYTSFRFAGEANSEVFLSVKNPDEKPNKLYKSSFGILIKADGSIQEYRNLSSISDIKATKTGDFIVKNQNDTYFISKDGQISKVANSSDIYSIDEFAKNNIFYIKGSKLFITYNDLYKVIDNPIINIENSNNEYVIKDTKGNIYFIVTDKKDNIFVYKLVDNFSFSQVAKFHEEGLSDINVYPLNNGLAIWSDSNNPKNIYIYNNGEASNYSVDNDVKGLRKLASLKDAYIIYPYNQSYFLKLNKDTSKVSKIDLSKTIYDPFKAAGNKAIPDFRSVIVNSTEKSFGMLFKDPSSGEDYKFIFWMDESGEIAPYLLPDDADNFDTENSPLKSDTGQLFYVNTTDPSRGYNRSENHFVLTVIGNDGNANKYTATDGSIYTNYEWLSTYFYTGKNKSGVIVFVFHSNAQPYEYNSSFWISNTDSYDLTQLKAPDIFGTEPSTVLQVGGDYSNHQANLFIYKDTDFYVNIHKDGSYLYVENRAMKRS
ncbi:MULTISPECIES: hypothetical protein [unclassified Francisella]|uniref:hypothetical protein n=1 Tax=unclassified Francisella TaxID=2610885 RepID=UPI002E37B104|nr:MULTISPECIES: hypothetical protein [unclassified Francisella]MED7819313.1 hypothetical protein [Francisella sp. 19S2-4]MED7830057.1 hypothetical protein [Francisella sp. 19S2-10]